MKRLMITAICVAAVGCGHLTAQTIVDDLQTHTKATDGQIRIECDPAIAALVGRPGAVAFADEQNATHAGFRIQVFMGNRPGQARAEATAKQKAIQEQFPELASYLNYVAPNWKLTVGDFLTRKDAETVKQQLERAFPSFGKEMYIVAEKIKLADTLNEER